MKKSSAKEKTVPVPVRGKIIIVAAVILLFTASVALGMQRTVKGDMPVVLADGDIITPPYYIVIDGEKTVLVESRDAAERVIKNVIDEYENGSENIIDIHLEEETKIEKKEVKHGDELPKIMTEEEAKKELIYGNDGEGYLTVVVTSEKNNIESVEYTEEYKAEPELYIGETIVETAGEEGFEKVTSIVISENGKAVEEKIIEKETIKEPIQQTVLKGTKSYTGCGGGKDAIDVGVSYNENAVFSNIITPVPSVYISSQFGPRWGGFHTGIDLALEQGKPIYAADGGVVYHSAYSGGYGNLIKIDHGNGMQTYYAHCSKLLVSQGAEVEAGETIGLVGSTGNSTGPHLHFEVIINGTRVNPLEFLDLE